MDIAKELIAVSRDIMAMSWGSGPIEMKSSNREAGGWMEDADVDELRERAIREFKRHVGAEPIRTAEKIKGRWYVVTTELGAYRLLRKYRGKWKDIGKHQSHPGWWYTAV